MEITLEKIELVKDRTGVSYREAKEALENANGSVVDAIIAIEESMDYMNSDRDDDETPESMIKQKIRKTIEKGNMSRIIVRKGDTILLNLPLTAGILGAVVAPWGAIFGVIAAAGFNCKIEFVNNEGQITDINGKVKTQYRKARTQGQIYYDKGMEKVDKIKESEFYGDLKEKGTDMYNGLKDKSQDMFDDLKEKSGEGLDKEHIKESLEELKRKGVDFFRKKDDADDSDDDFFEEFDLDVDGDDSIIMPEATEEETKVKFDDDVVLGEAIPEEPSEGATAPKETTAQADVSTEDLEKILNEVAFESGINTEN